MHIYNSRIYQYISVYTSIHIYNTRINQYISVYTSIHIYNSRIYQYISVYTSIDISWGHGETKRGECGTLIERERGGERGGGRRERERET